MTTTTMTVAVRTRRGRTEAIRYMDGGVGEVRVSTLQDAMVVPGRGAVVVDVEQRHPVVDSPERAVEALKRAHIACGDVWAVETAYALLLTVRRRVLGWVRLSQGTVDSMLIDPSTVYRAAIAAGAKAVVLAHTHPSGDPTPSEGDIRATRDLIRAGQVLKVELLDHVILGNPQMVPLGQRGWASLKELGYFYC